MGCQANYGKEGSNFAKPTSRFENISVTTTSYQQGNILGNNLTILPSTYKWGLALVTTVLAAILFAPQIFLLTGTMCQGFGFNPQVKVSGAPTVGLFLFLALIFFLLLRLIYQWVPICPIDRWRYTVISAVLALLLFAPFLTSAFSSLLSGGMSEWLGGIFLVELVLFFLIVRLSLL